MTQLVKYDVDFSQTQIAMVKEVLCPGISDAQLAMFSQVCKHKKLDPFSRQIYATLRWDKDTNSKKLSIQTGIDGFRLIAERTGKYGGQDDFEWCGKDGVWRDVWLEATQPVAARATVWRKDWPKPFRRVARWSAYVQDRSPMWQKMGAEMLAKCAEALAFRGAFPEELSGLYTDDEMGETTTLEGPATPPPAPPKEPEPPKEPPPRKLPTATSSKYEPAKSVPFKSLATPQLVTYLAHYTAKLAAGGMNDFHTQGVRDHIAAAELELALRRRAEAEMAGANKETGEITDAQFEESPKSDAPKEREPGEDDEP